MRREELKGVEGKQADGSARTRELKLGSVFTQTTTDEVGQSLRDPDSTSYVGTLEDCRHAGSLLGDGSAWVWENARLNFPDAVQLLDFYHGSEHVGTLAEALWGTDTQQAKEWQRHRCSIMKATDTHTMLGAADELLTRRWMNSVSNLPGARSTTSSAIATPPVMVTSAAKAGSSPAPW